eukprot:gene56284-42155_t
MLRCYGGDGDMAVLRCNGGATVLQQCYSATAALRRCYG